MINSPWARTAKRKKAKKASASYSLWIYWPVNISESSAAKLGKKIGAVSRRRGFKWEGQGCDVNGRGGEECNISLSAPSKAAAESAAKNVRAARIRGVRTHVVRNEPV